MASLPTQGFSMSRLPQYGAIDPRRFEFDQEALGQAITFVPRTLAELDRLNEVRNEFGTLKATRGARRVLATQTADAAAEDFPLQRSVRNAGLEADLPAQGVRKVTAERELGSLSRNADQLTSLEDLDVENANRTAEAKRADMMQADYLRLPDDEAMAAQRAAAKRKVDAEQALINNRDAQSELSIAKASAATAKIALDREKMERALDTKKSVRMFKNEDMAGRTTGYVAAIFDTTTGEFITQELDARGQRIGQPNRSKAVPTTGEVDPGSVPVGQTDAAAPVVAPSRGSSLLGSPATATPAAPAGAPAANIPAPLPTFTVEQSRLIAPGVRFTGTNGVVYEKQSDGSVRPVK